MTRKLSEMQAKTTVWDKRNPWASIAHALKWHQGVPVVIIVPGEPPAASFSMDGLMVKIRRADDALGVVCAGNRDISMDAKELCLVRMGRGRAP